MNAQLSLSFRNVSFDITDIHGQPWLRGLQVASAMGYKNPAADIVNLYNRNADEFTDSMTQVIELLAPKQPKSSATGCWTYWRKKFQVAPANAKPCRPA